MICLDLQGLGQLGPKLLMKEQGTRNKEQEKYGDVQNVPGWSRTTGFLTVHSILAVITGWDDLP
jgi:hypothetical protein